MRQYHLENDEIRPKLLSVTIND